MTQYSMDKYAELTNDGQVSKDNEFSAVFALDNGWYPATVLGLRGPFPRKPGQWYKNGSMRIYADLEIDGTFELLDSQGVPVPPETDEKGRSWYRVSCSYNWGLSSNHPPTFDGDKPAAWTEDFAQVKRYTKPMANSSDVNGTQTFFGFARECRAIDYDESNNPRVMFNLIPGARVQILLEYNEEQKRTYGKRIRGEASMPAGQRISEQPDPQFLTKLVKTKGQDVIRALREAPKPKDGNSSGDAPVKIAPTPLMLEFMKGVLDQAKEIENGDYTADVKSEAVAFKQDVRRIIQDACIKEGGNASKFSQLMDKSVQVEVLTAIGGALGKRGLLIATDFEGSTENWTKFVQTEYAQAAGLEPDGDDDDPV